MHRGASRGLRDLDKMRKQILFLALGIFLICFISAQDVSYCCEKTNYNAWCQNEAEIKCDASFRKVPASCEATSYCKLGTCIDNTEGTCMENIPQRRCEDPNGDGSKSDGGVWFDKKSDELPQCNLGCCLIGDQAAFVTQTRCKRLSSLYGLETNFRTDIKNEMTCIASATSETRGACVFEKDYETTCLMLTQKECAQMIGKTENSSNIKFHKDYLCSDENLGTNCGPSKKTTCVEGKDEVYFVDTCGNIANIYDSSKVNDKEYWSKIKSKSGSCGFGSSNADSSSCGSCDYYLGSTCKKYSSSKDKKPNYGDSICRDLSCKYESKTYKHGETWCADSKGSKDNLPGSRYFRLVCYNSEVTVEPCADFRQETCIQSDISGFKTAACRVNQWQDCYAQTNQANCENKDRRDCSWVKDKCVPANAPGFDFWQAGDAEQICSLGNRECVVVFEKKLSGSKKCVKNCECLTEAWKTEMNKICTSLGDCGSKTNFIGIKGYHDERAYYSGTNSSG